MPLDTPGDRRARDEAQGIDVEAADEAREKALVAAAGGEVVVATETYRPNRYGRRNDVRRAAMVASAARINLKDRKAKESLRRRRQGWQTESWDYFDEVGEIGYTTTYIANLMSKLRLYPAIEGEDGPIAVSVLFDEETDSEEEGDEHRNAVATVRELGITPDYAQLSIDTIRRLRSQQGGQSALVRELSLNLEVAGECYIHGHTEPAGEPDPGGDLNPVGTIADEPEEIVDPTLVEDWNIRSIDELISTGDEFQLRRGPGIMGQALDSDDLVIRIWERHPRFSEMATCAMRRVLAEAEALLLLSREIRATSKSRLSNGILLIPSELSFGAIDPTHDGGDGEETEDPFDSELQEAMITPIQEEGSASAVVPLVLRGPAELLQHVNHLALDKTLDPVLDARIEQRILRIARGLNMPTEVTTGLMATTFANAVQVKRSEFEDHIEPRAVLVCDAITSGYFQWTLEVAGVPAEIARRVFIWFDASALIKVEDQSEQAVKAHEDGVISDAARRRYTGFKEEDAPDAHELAMRILLRGGRIDPTIFGYLLRAALDDSELPVPAPPAGVLGVPQSVSALPVPGAAPTVPVDVGGETVQPPPPPPEPPEPDPTAPQPPASPDGQEPAQAPPATSEAPPAPVAAAGAGDDEAWGRLGSQLVGIDRELRTRIIGKLDQAMMNALERAGVRIKAKVQRGQHAALRPITETKPAHLVAAALGREVVEATGATSDELLAQAFDSALESVGTWLTAGYEKAVRTVEKVTGPFEPAARSALDARTSAGVERATEFLRANLHQLAEARLYSPDPTAPEAGEYDGTVLIPASMVRVAIAIAGGEAPKGGSVVASAWLQLGGAGPVMAEDGTPLGGLASGPAMMSEIGGFGGRTQGWQWAYGEGMRSEFPPHVRLDGTIVATTDDPAWANQGGFPGTDYYFPGDHDGCVCDIIPVFVSPAGTSMGTQEPSIEDIAAESVPGGMLGPAVEEGAVEEGATEAAAAEEEAWTPSTMSAGEFADAFGWTRLAADEPTEADLEAAAATVNEVRRSFQDAARQVYEEHMAALRLVEGDQGMLHGTLGLVSERGGDTKGWFEGLSKSEQARLRANWQRKAGEKGIDWSELSQFIAERIPGVTSTGGSGGALGTIAEDQAWEWWLNETRIVDAAKALANGRVINPERYGGLDINRLLDSPYDLVQLFRNKTTGTAEVAQAIASESRDEALYLLTGNPSGRYGGLEPWKMTQAEYVAKVEDLEARAAAIVPLSDDPEWGPTYSSADETVLRELGEMVPAGIEDSASIHLGSLYMAIVKIAREGGLL